MKNSRETVTFYVSAIVYLLFNLRPGSTFLITLKATGLQILQTAPYVAGATFIVISFLQYLAEGEKVPWDRRFRIFFLIGIMVGLFYSIYEYAGKPAVQ